MKNSINNFMDDYNNKLIDIMTNYPILKKTGKRLMLDIYDTIQSEQKLKSFDEYSHKFDVSFENELYDRFYDIVHQSEHIQLTNEVVLMASGDYEELHNFMDSKGWILSMRHEFGDDFKFIYSKKHINEEDFSYYYFYVVPHKEFTISGIDLKGLTPKLNGDLYSDDSTIRLFTYTDIMNLKGSIKYNKGKSLTHFPFLNNFKDNGKFDELELVIYKVDSSKIKDAKFFLNTFDPKNPILWTYKNIPAVAVQYFTTLSLI